MNDYQYLFKFILIGDSNVGKSCLLLRFLQGRFKNQHEPTLGVEFGSKICNIKEKKIKLQVWDTAGQESFKSITRAYYKGSIGALLVFDISSENSFNNLKNWLYQLRNHSHQKMRIFLIGNKSDLAKQREVSEETIHNFVKESKIDQYFQTSALNGTNVEKPFLEMGVTILQAIQNGLINPTEDSAFGIKNRPIKGKYANERVNISSQPLKLKQSERCAC